MNILLTFLTIIGCLYILFPLCFRYLTIILDGTAVGEPPIASLFFGVLFLGISLSLLFPVGFEWLFYAYNHSNYWSEHFVFHFPTSHDFWAVYIPKHWPLIQNFVSSGFSLNGSQYHFQYWGFAAYLIGSSLLIWARFGKKGRIYAEIYTFRGGIQWAFFATLCVFIMIQTTLFVLSYLVGTLVFISGFWIALIIFMAIGSVDFGTRVFDSNGKYFGTIYRD